ncbi:hypothetical protein DNTS_035294 [Danionella cerebrum]|uniref:Ig-like domain-containing protein n=1 Tax=Danionella cerebrum TaxID=2873325 RepID=A0A553QC04_9TELE|nr:hypothetical protein DNTS_035294 [Danionella translucida]
MCLKTAKQIWNLMGHRGNSTMLISVVFLALLQILTHQPVSSVQVQHNVIAEKGENATLQCLDKPDNSSSLVFYRWMKNAVVVATQNPTEPAVHLSISHNGSLRITGLLNLDAGVYECQSQGKDGSLWNTLSNVQLEIADGPTDVRVEVAPAFRLKNGTLYVEQGSDVNFSCFSESQPSQILTWLVYDSALDNQERASGNNSYLGFFIYNIQPMDQGTYTCSSQNPLSMRSLKKSQELLVYYAPERHPECSWEVTREQSSVLFTCTWFGGYPVPTLSWRVQEESVIAKDAVINFTSQEAERLEVRVNRSLLHNKDEVMCTGRHALGVERFCSFTLRHPLVTALEDTSITLSCTETNSLPPAKTYWKKHDDVIINNSLKYIVSDNRPTFTLTIVNVTKADEGVFFCYSENPLGARELEVYLNVKTSAENGGAVVGIFVSILVMMIGIVVGVTVYTKRDRICIVTEDYHFISHLEDRGDILSLVDSDEEEIFSDSIPRLPPPANGHATTLVEIHRIPSSDHEDNAGGAEQTDQTQPADP